MGKIRKSQTVKLRRAGAPCKKSPEERKKMMSAIRSRDTVPELAVRREAHRMGYRFRLHRKGLPGTPDLVFPSRRKAVFVHGCFWHAHGCKLSRAPKTNLDYWIPKLKHNCARDVRNLEALTTQGWKHLVIWECESRDIRSLEKRLKKFLK
jgi:DNA mismatch endonuclease (patch repair protein)